VKILFTLLAGFLFILPAYGQIPLHPFETVATWPNLKHPVGRLQHIQQAVRKIERASMLFDAEVTTRALMTPNGIPPYQAMGVDNGSWPAPAEANTLMTRFGNRNVAGVDASLAAFEIAASYASLFAPRLARRVLGTKGETAARVAVIGFSLYQTEEHVRCGIGDIRARDEFMTRYNWYVQGIPQTGRP
jgi:hypothetical protein